MKFLLLLIPFATAAQTGPTLTAIASPRGYGAAIAKTWHYPQGFVSTGLEGLRIGRETLVSVQVHGAVYAGRFVLIAGTGVGSFLSGNYTAYAEGGLGVWFGKLVVSGVYRSGASKFNGTDVEGWYSRISINF